MKTIETKSLILGVAAALLVFTLTSSKMNENDNAIEFVSSPTGPAIYNKQTKTLYMYSMAFGKLNPKPQATFKVAEDGSALTEIK